MTRRPRNREEAPDDLPREPEAIRVETTPEDAIRTGDIAVAASESEPRSSDVEEHAGESLALVELIPHAASEPIAPVEPIMSFEPIASSEATAEVASEVDAAVGPGEQLSDEELLRAVSALVFASPEPLSVRRLVDLLDSPARARVEAALSTLRERLQAILDNPEA